MTVMYSNNVSAIFTAKRFSVDAELFGAAAGYFAADKLFSGEENFSTDESFGADGNFSAE